MHSTNRAISYSVEGIADLKEMAVGLIKKFQGYQKMVEKKTTPGPKRILFYRDGVSGEWLRLSCIPSHQLVAYVEGQFQFVLDHELKALKGWSFG
jgi:hypothetical protein